jgi:hypothetical protein
VVQQPEHVDGVHRVPASPGRHTPKLHVELEGHAPHCAPESPQVKGVWLENGTHAAPWQQPLGHEADVQLGVPEQVPFVHSEPVGQALHVAPPVPHRFTPCALVGMHWPPRQQPLHVRGLQVGAVQRPPEHWPPGGHAWHTEPPRPHCAAFWSGCGTHWPVAASQHPFGQLCGVQRGGPPTHWPLMHASPGLHPMHCRPLAPQSCSD